MHQLQDTAFAWPAHEPKYESYTGWTPVQVILNEHFEELTKAQNEIDEQPMRPKTFLLE